MGDLLGTERDLLTESFSRGWRVRSINYVEVVAEVPLKHACDEL